MQLLRKDNAEWVDEPPRNYMPSRYHNPKWRFDLAFYSVGSPPHGNSGNACYDLDVHHEDYEYLMHRFEPDDVKALHSGDWITIATIGGEKATRRMQETRRRRRDTFKRIAGMLGLHFLEKIEKQEGWPNA